MQQEDIKYLLKLNSVIFRRSQIYLDKVLKEFELSSGSYPYLFVLKDNEGISQSKISEELGCDKAMTARTITKLIDLGYIDRQKDESNYKSNKIYLTNKARIVIVQLIDKINELIFLMTADLSEQEKLNTMDSLNKINCNIKNLNI